MADSKKQNYEPRYTGVLGAARAIGKTIVRSIEHRAGGNSGMSGQAGRSVSGRQRQVDDAVERMQRGQSSDSNN